MLAKRRQHLIDGRARHYLRALRAGVNMAVLTGLITELADVDLQHLDRRGSQSETVHGELLLERDSRACAFHRVRQTDDRQLLSHHIETFLTASCACNP